MKRTFLDWITGFGLSFCLSLAAHAQAPATMSYQGVLTTTQGAPVSATLSMTFALYSTSTGGSALWSETLTVPVSDGVYSVTLGGGTTLDLPFDVPYYMGVRVGGDAEMTPRMPLAAAPYARYARRAGCNPGDRIGCYTGVSNTLDVGACRTGLRVCGDDGASFGSCQGEVVPGTEICNDQIDNDCNGVVDDCCACNIDGVCRAPGVVNPANACEVCDPGQSTSAWSALVCNDDIACTADACQAQAGCFHTPNDAYCDDNNECTADSCDAGVGCANQPVSNGTPCGPAAGTCQQGVCQP